MRHQQSSCDHSISQIIDDLKDKNNQAIKKKLADWQIDDEERTTLEQQYNLLKECKQDNATLFNTIIETANQQAETRFAQHLWVLHLKSVWYKDQHAISLNNFSIPHWGRILTLKDFSYDSSAIKKSPTGEEYLQGWKSLIYTPPSWRWRIIYGNRWDTRYPTDYHMITPQTQISDLTSIKGRWWCIIAKDLSQPLKIDDITKALIKETNMLLYKIRHHTYPQSQYDSMCRQLIANANKLWQKQLCVCFPTDTTNDIDISAITDPQNNIQTQQPTSWNEPTQPTTPPSWIDTREKTTESMNPRTINNAFASWSWKLNENAKKYITIKDNERVMITVTTTKDKADDMQVADYQKISDFIKAITNDINTIADNRSKTNATTFLKKFLQSDLWTTLQCTKDDPTNNHKLAALRMMTVIIDLYNKKNNTTDTLETLSSHDTQRIKFLKFIAQHIDLSSSAKYNTTSIEVTIQTIAIPQKQQPNKK